jgi:hypothetical protein
MNKSNLNTVNLKEDIMNETTKIFMKEQDRLKGLVNSWDEKL